ncbi:hypothetical protein COB55_00955 [Candidatus Wolfebacteria bacterium]|nr:MAG: hypothetical protein COB55_00955 [Candidatus Wolfebacteria bacterium]
MNTHKKGSVVAGITIIVASIVAFGLWTAFNEPKEIIPEDPYIAWSLELYDVILENYWNEMPEEQLAEIYRLGAGNLLGDEQTLASTTRESIGFFIEGHIALFDDTQKKDFVTQLGHLVLQNLEPFGRSALYTAQREKELRNTVANINPEKDLYADLAVEKGASEEEVEEAFEEKKEELEELGTPEAAAELEKVEYAKEVLTNDVDKKKYDDGGIEPTVFTEELDERTLYMKISKVSPTTFNEFIRRADSVTNENLDTLILDLRDNIGGAVDTLPWFLGPFIGPGQYAYDLFHQGEYEPYKTQVGWLPSLGKYKRTVVLINENSQSSAETMAATLQKYNVGVVVGVTTRGHGTIENTFAVETVIDENETYSAFLVHSITLRPDGQPIEGRGVDPTISITSPDWEDQLNQYFNDESLVANVYDLVTPL